MQAFRAVRDAEIRGVCSPNSQHAASAAAFARGLDVGEARAYASIGDMVADPAIDAIWLTGPNHARVENVEEIVKALKSGKGTLRGIACEKPLARTLAEAERVTKLVKGVGLMHGYLENQVFAPDLHAGRELLWRRGAASAGRPYLARAAEEHSGPHAPWFWRADQQGGGALHDLMCHSALLVRHLLTRPGAPRSSVQPLRVTAHIASLKWGRPSYSRRLTKTFGQGIDYGKRPSEDFANLYVEFATDDGHIVVGEASTSWSYIGAGLRLSAELLGPEYSMSWNSLDSGLKLFFSREVRGSAGEDLIEKQNAEQGLMPVVSNEAATYGYENEDRHFVRAFLGLEEPMLTFDDGVEVMKILMTAYKSAELGKTLAFAPRGIEKFVPAVARGRWKPRSAAKAK
jgi:predicted dehydrogenase